jgi:hypothetical protein
MTVQRTSILLVAATFIGGLLAGGNVDRAFVAMPAWEHVGAIAWGQFSRHADLGNSLVLYPLEAFGSTLLTLAAASSFYFDRVTRRDAAAPLYIAALLCIAGLIFTIKAAPLMLGIREVNEPGALQSAFEGFRLWGNVRGACQVLAFAAQLWGLGVLSHRS